MAVFTEISAEDLSEISKAFGIEDLRSVQGVAGGSVNTIYWLETGGGNFYLRFDEVKKPPDVALEMEFLAYLAQEGFPCPAPLATKEPLGKGNSEPKSQFLMAWEASVVSITPECAGQVREDRAYSLGHLKEVGGLLARLVLTGKGFSCNQTLHDRFSLKCLRKIFDRGKTELDPSLQPYSQGIEAEFQFQNSMEADLKALPQAIVHGDLFADNLFFVDGHVASLIDFDAAATKPALFDLCTAFNSLCFFDRKFSWEKIRVLITGYEALRPLEPLEKEKIVDIWRLSSLRFTVTRIQDFHLRKAPNSGLISRDFRDFYDRLEFQRTLTSKEFWRQMKGRKG